MFRILLLLSASALFQGNAFAGELSYKWEAGEIMRYRVQAYVVAPRVLQFIAARNDTARAEEIALALELECTAQPPGKKTLKWRCIPHRSELGGVAWSGEQERLDAIFAEYKPMLDKATIVAEFTPTGRMKHVDLEGFPRDTDREKLIQEYLRLLLQRVFASLELELPKSGEQPSGAWRQKGSPLSMRLPTRYGTAGGVRLNHEVVGQQDDLLLIQSIGRGTVTPGSALEAGSDQAVNLSVTGNAQFDPVRGVLVRNEVQVSGALSVSASMASAGFYISQVLLAELLESWDEPGQAPAEEAPAVPAEEAPAEEAESSETSPETAD